MRDQPYKPLLHRRHIVEDEPDGFSPERPDLFHEAGATHLAEFTPSMMAWLEELATFMTVGEIADEIEKYLPLSRGRCQEIAREFETLPLA
jgi:hypothetical protein